MVFACWPSAWNGVASSGRQLPKAALHSYPLNCPCCSKALTGAVPNAPRARYRHSDLETSLHLRKLAGMSSPADLPDDIAALKAIIAECDAALAHKEVVITELREQLSTRRDRSSARCDGNHDSVAAVVCRRLRTLVARLVAVIRIDAIWLATEPLDMRAGMDMALARVVRVFGSARPHHTYPFGNRRATRMKVLDYDGFGLWLVARRLNKGRVV